MSMATSFSRGRGEGYAPRRGGFGSWRGGNNSSRGRGGKPWSYVNDKRHNTPDIKKHPLGSLLRTFKGLDTTSPVSDAAELLSFKVCDNRLQISDCQYIASYNWLGSTEPTIMTPGLLVISKYRLNSNILKENPRDGPLSTIPAS
jgi:hypothetical protein